MKLLECLIGFASEVASDELSLRGRTARRPA
jgi:hypothetical protein